MTIVPINPIIKFHISSQTSHFIANFANFLQISHFLANFTFYRTVHNFCKSTFSYKLHNIFSKLNKNIPKQFQVPNVHLYTFSMLFKQILRNISI